MSYPYIVHTSNSLFRIVRTNETTIVIEKGDCDAMGNTTWKTHQHSGVSGIGAIGTTNDTQALLEMTRALLALDNQVQRLKHDICNRPDSAADDDL